MRYIKTFEELNVDLEILKSKLEELSYILQDEGFVPNFDLRPIDALRASKKSLKNAEKYIHISILGYTKNDLMEADTSGDFLALNLTAKHKIENLVSSDYYKEWIDRISELCRKFGMSFDQIGEHVKSGVFFKVLNISQKRPSLASVHWDIKESVTYKEVGEDAIQTLEDLKYIMEDEGYYLKYKKINLTLGGRIIREEELAKNFLGNDRISVILINVDKADPSKSLNRRNLIKCEEYQEFMERLTDECKSLGYVVFSPREIVDLGGRSSDYPDIIFITNVKEFPIRHSGYDYYLNVF